MLGSAPFHLVCTVFINILCTIVFAEAKWIALLSNESQVTHSNEHINIFFTGNGNIAIILVVLF